jgi:DNA-binding NarL/FixJ family response regulator
MAQKELQVSILIACGSTLAGELYSQALNRRAGFHVVSRVASVAETLRVVQSTEVDIALISTVLEDGPQGGLIALQEIQKACPKVKSVVLFEGSEAHVVVTAFRAGAKGVFCPGEEGFKRLCRCVEKVHAGQVWANSSQLHQVLEAFSRQTPFRVVNSEGARLLTKREEDVVHLVEEGCTNRQIAAALQLSEHTVRNNLFRIFEKLGVSTRVELALYAVNTSKRSIGADAQPDNGGSETGRRARRLPVPVNKRPY